MLELARPLIFFDLETTGPVIGIDRIVQVGLVTYHPDGRIETWQSRVNPGMPIPPEASEVHGLTDADIATAPRWEHLARDLSFAFAGCDVAGYNVARFDWPMLQAELERVHAPIPGPAPVVVDVMRLFHQLVPRDLAAACETYLGRALEGAHDALADARATALVLSAQLERHPDLPRTPAGLAELLDRSRPYGGKLVERGGRLLITFGKHLGRALSDIDDGWCRWFIGQDFPGDAKAAVREELERRRAEAAARAARSKERQGGTAAAVAAMGPDDLPEPPPHGDEDAPFGIGRTGT